MINWKDESDTCSVGSVGYNIFDSKGREAGHCYLILAAKDGKSMGRATATRDGEEFGACQSFIHFEDMTEAKRAFEAKAINLEKSSRKNKRFSAKA